MQTEKIGKKNILRVLLITLIGIQYGSVLTAQVNSEWYIENQKQIDSIRKGDFVIQIVDDLGEPVDAEVDFKLVKHEFPWGTALDLTGSDTWYSATARKYFNYGVTENAFKWSSMQPYPGPVNYDNVNEYLDWCDEGGWEMRGHTLLWGSTSYEDTHPLQKWVKDLPPKPDMWDTCKARVQREMTYYKGIIKEYDVLNEPTPGHADWLQETVGDSINWYCFKWADEIDPDADLYVNDYGMITGGDFYLNYMNTIQKMLDNGAPLDGIGVQGHFGRSISPTSMKTALDSLSTFGLPIRITEFDMRVGDYNLTEELQARYYALAMRAAFAHPSVNGFLFWGFWDERHWRDEAGIFGTNKAPKIAADSVYSLLYDVWASNEKKVSTEGNIDINAFYGTYEITATVNGEDKHFTTSLLKDQNDTIKIQFSEGSIPPPQLDSIVVERENEVRMFFDQKMITTGMELNEFIVIRGSAMSVLSVSQPESDSSQIILQMDDTFNSNSTVSVIYSSGTVKSAIGGDLQAFGPEYARNKLPGFVSGYTNEEGSLVSSIFSLELDELTIEENVSSFTLLVDNIEMGISSIEQDSEDASIINIIPEETIPVNTIVKIGYTPGTIKSAIGGYLPEFTPKLVANNVVTGIGELNYNFNIYGIYNERNKTIEIHYLNETEEVHLNMVSISGESVLTNTRIHNDVIHLPNLSPGVYIIRFTDNQGQKTKIQKIIIGK